MTYHWFLAIRRDGGAACIDVDTGLSIENPRFRFRMDMGSEAAAELMAKHLCGKLGALVEQAREEAYEDGYRDGRGKKAKCDWQSSRLGWESP